MSFFAVTLWTFLVSPCFLFFKSNRKMFSKNLIPYKFVHQMILLNVEMLKVEIWILVAQLYADFQLSDFFAI